MIHVLCSGPDARCTERDIEVGQGCLLHESIYEKDDLGDSLLEDAEEYMPAKVLTSRNTYGSATNMLLTSFEMSPPSGDVKP